VLVELFEVPPPVLELVEVFVEIEELFELEFVVPFVLVVLLATLFL